MRQARNSIRKIEWREDVPLAQDELQEFSLGSKLVQLVSNGEMVSNPMN
jgi:hypothetical protein